MLYRKALCDYYNNKYWMKKKRGKGERKEKMRKTILPCIKPPSSSKNTLLTMEFRKKKTPIAFHKKDIPN